MYGATGKPSYAYVMRYRKFGAIFGHIQKTTILSRLAGGNTNAPPPLLPPLPVKALLQRLELNLGAWDLLVIEELCPEASALALALAPLPLPLGRRPASQLQERLCMRVCP